MYIFGTAATGCEFRNALHRRGTGTLARLNGNTVPCCYGHYDHRDQRGRYGTRLKLLPRSAAGPDGEIERRGETIQCDAYRIDFDVTIRGGRPGDEFLERRGRAAHTVSNKPHEVHVVPWSQHLVAGTASGSQTRVDLRSPLPDLAADRTGRRRRICRPNRNSGRCNSSGRRLGARTTIDSSSWTAITSSQQTSAAPSGGWVFGR